MEGNNNPPKCIFCNNEGIYRCPGCSRLTCSLKCCKEHKKKYNCTGKRDRTSFVSMKDYGDTTLRRDYHFLEDVMQSKQSSRRGLLRDGILNENQEKVLQNNSNNNNKNKNNNSKNNKNHYREDTVIGKHSRSTKKLVSEAKSRGINLILMSPGMSKRTHNSTKIVRNKIHWQIQFVFLKLKNVEFSKISTIDHYVNNTSYLAFHAKAIPEDMTLQDILTAWRKEQPNEEKKEKKTESNNETNTNTNSNTSNVFSMPQQCEQEAQTLLQHSGDGVDVDCYLPISIQEESPSFLLLNQTSTITEICKQQKVIEYPTIYISRSHLLGHSSVKNSITILEDNTEDVTAPPLSSSSSKDINSTSRMNNIETNDNEDESEDRDEDRAGIGAKKVKIDGEVAGENREGDEDDDDNENANDFLEALQDFAGQDSDVLRQMLHP